MLRTMQEKGEVYVIVPLKEYERLSSSREMHEDVRAYDAAKLRNEEAFPMRIYDAIDAGENPIRVFREYRGRTLRQLAGAAGISEAYLSQIESGKRKGSANVLKAISGALGLTLDDIV